jgi:hypothetical protein
VKAAVLARGYVGKSNHDIIFRLRRGLTHQTFISQWLDIVNKASQRMREILKERGHRCVRTCARGFDVDVRQDKEQVRNRSCTVLAFYFKELNLPRADIALRAPVGCPTSTIDPMPCGSVIAHAVTASTTVFTLWAGTSGHRPRFLNRCANTSFLLCGCTCRAECAFSEIENACHYALPQQQQLCYIPERDRKLSWSIS